MSYITYDRHHPATPADVNEFVYKMVTDSQFRQGVFEVAQAGGQVVTKIGGHMVNVGKHLANRIVQTYNSSGGAQKRARVDVKTEAGADPVNHAISKRNFKLPIGVTGVFTGGETVERPLSLVCGSSKSTDVLRNFLREFSQVKKLTTQFACQYVGDDQVRSCQGLVFRHRNSATSGVTATRRLKADYTYNPVQCGDTPGVLLQGLPYNYFYSNTANDGGDNMKAMISDTTIGDLENLAGQITPLAALGRVDISSSHTYTNESTLASGDSHLPSSYGTWVSSYLSNYGYGTSGSAIQAHSQRNRNVIVTVKNGGCKLFFENKHPIGSFVEVVFYKWRAKDQELAPTVGFASGSAGPDVIMDQLQTSCGSSYVQKATANSVNITAGSGTSFYGHVPYKTDVTVNPYFPLLPRARYSADSNETSISPNKWSEKRRIRFHLQSGHKRSVNIQFGGLKYDPISACESEFVCMVVIAINGQMVSGYAQQVSTGDQLVTGDLAAGHNMLVRGEYYEYVTPLKCSNSRMDVFTGNDLEPLLPSRAGAVVNGQPSSDVTFSAYQILPASTAQRGNNVKIESGVTIDPTDGKDYDDVDAGRG